MDPIDSGQGREKPPESCNDQTPSSKGRQRKKNPKYFDYVTDETLEVQSTGQKASRKSSGGRGGAAAAASRSTPAKRAKVKNDAQQIADTEIEATDKTPPETDGKMSEETPRKAVRAKKTPTKKTPARKTPAKKTPAKKTPAKKAATSDGDLPAGEGGAVDTVQQENGTPKRKYVRKRPAHEAVPVTEPACKEAQVEPQTEPEEEPQPGGRRRRGAAKAALKYLHLLAKEVLNHPSDESGFQPEADSDITHTGPDSVTEHKSLKGSKGRKGRKRKRADSDSDAADDEDFVPDVQEEEAEEMDGEEDEGEDSGSDFGTGGKSPAAFHINRTHTGPYYKTSNGLHCNIMKSVWEAAETTKKFREEHYSSWVFPAWVPSTTDWHPVPQSELEKYLPEELQSAAFKVSRVGLSQEDTPLQRLSRFAAVPAHPDRWDMLLFAGGPVWAMEWCPTPDGAPASQYVALACHQGMDNQHYVNNTYTGPGLVQLWDVGKLDYNSRPDSQPALAYGLAQDKGFIWQLKWCPAGGWEPPTCGRKAPFLPRLGLLAVATSTSVVTIYSLPHPDALHSSNKQDKSASQQLPVYQVQGVLTLKLGSFKALRHERSGQVLSMDWLPVKPHNIMAIGFYDGVVGLWDLSSKSALLRVREPDKSLSLLPYRCLVAHDHAVRALAFCPASRHLLVTAGEDRLVKTWDLRRLYTPITVLKRFLTNEVCWPLNAPGYMLAQENAYAAIGSHGIHYFDLNLRSYFAVPRTGTVWSMSYTDWLNSVVTSDILGEVILAVLPQICYSPQYVKRTLERRFPVYLTSLVPYDTKKEGGQEEGGAQEEEEEEEGGGAQDEEEEEEGGRGGGGTETGGPDAGAEGGNESNNENRRHGGCGRRDQDPPLHFQPYREAVRKYYLHHTDNNMETFAGSEKRAVWKHMKNTEVKAKLNMDEMPLAALHKVRFSPNMCCHTWVVSGGQTGLVRLNCLRGLVTSQAKKCMKENQAQFTTLYSPKDPKEPVQTATADL